MKRSRVADIDLQKQLCEHMKRLTPRPSIYLPESIAENRAEVADKVFAGTKSELLDQVRKQLPHRSRPVGFFSDGLERGGNFGTGLSRRV